MIMGGGGGGGGGGNGAVALKVDIEGPDTRDLRGFGECPSPNQVWSPSKQFTTRHDVAYVRVSQAISFNAT